MIKTPDIQDIDDVDRFARNCYYPKHRLVNGDVNEVYLIRGLIPGSVLVHVWGANNIRQDESLSFEQFLTLEQGYYKSRLVEFDGSIVFVQNNGANEHSRNHSLKLGSIRFQHIHPEITEALEMQNQAYVIAKVALSTKRTPVFEALSKLENGEGVGYALSDNFGLITNDKSPNPQIVRRTKVIGEVEQNTPRIHEGYEHYYYAVNKLWR